MKVAVAGVALSLVFTFSAQGDVPRDERVRGAFLGLAYGDALGAVTETYSENEILSVFGRLTSLELPLPLPKILQVRGEKRFRPRRPGATTDDSQQAMGLILLSLMHPQWGHEGLLAFSRLLTEGASRDLWRGYGKMFAAAVSRLAGGTHYKQSGAFSSGIGAAMRVGPIAAIQTIADDTATDIVLTSSLVTHADVRAVAMSYAVYWVNRALVSGNALAAIRAELPNAVKKIEDRLMEMTDWRMDNSTPHSVSEVLRAVLPQASRVSTHREISKLVTETARPHLKPEFINELHANGAFVLLGGVHAIALSLQDEVSPLLVLQHVVNLGDDTDTVGAIAGSLLGARFGVDWIPLTQVQDSPRLVAYAESLLTGAPPETLEGYLHRETRLIEEERAFQRTCRQLLIPRQAP